jgi:hypothetical protein
MDAKSISGETQRAASWDGLFELYDKSEAPSDFMSSDDRDQGVQHRDPFDGWTE